MRIVDELACRFGRQAASLAPQMSKKSLYPSIQLSIHLSNSLIGQTVPGKASLSWHLSHRWIQDPGQKFLAKVWLNSLCVLVLVLVSDGYS